MSDEEIEREWRNDFRDRLKQIVSAAEKITEKLDDIRIDSVKQAELLELRRRLRILEDFRLRTITILVFVQAIFGAVVFVFEHYMR